MNELPIIKGICYSLIGLIIFGCVELTDYTCVRTCDDCLDNERCWEDCNDWAGCGKCTTDYKYFCEQKRNNGTYVGDVK